MVSVDVNIPRNEVYYMPFKQQITEKATLPEGAKTINPAYPNADSAHGQQPPNNNYRWKMYTRASVEDVYPQAAYNPKLTSYFGAPHCIISRVLQYF